jgi:hypothetical protein
MCEETVRFDTAYKAIRLVHISIIWALFYSNSLGFVR